MSEPALRQDDPPPLHEVQHARHRALVDMISLTSRPMTVLSLVWLGLIIVELSGDVDRPLRIFSDAIWALFVVVFLIELALAPDRRVYLRHNWLTAVSLLLPALRLLRAVSGLRALATVRVLRAVSLLRFVTWLNQGMRSLALLLRQRGLGYVAVFSVVLTFAAAGLLYALEREAVLGPSPHGATLQDYSDAVWWASMQLTSVGSEYVVRTPGGRILAWMVSIFGLAVFGFLTAAIASYFVGQDSAEQERVEKQQHAALRDEVSALRDEIRQLNAHFAARADKGGSPPA